MRRSPSPQRKDSPGVSPPRRSKDLSPQRRRTPSPQRRSSPVADRRTPPTRRDESPRRRPSPRDSPDGGFQQKEDNYGGNRRPYDSERSYGRERGRPYDSDRSYGRNRPGNYGNRDESSFGQGWGRGERSRQYNGGSDRYERGSGDRYDNRGRERYDRGGDRHERGGDRYERGGGDRYSRGGTERGGYRSGGGIRYDYRDRRRSPDEPRDDPPVERRKIVLQPRSKPLESEETSGQSSAIFGGAKPVDTAKKEREVEEKLEKAREQERKLSEGGEGSGETKKSSVFGDAKPVDTSKRDNEIEERIREARELADSEKKDSSSDHQRKGTTDQQQQTDRPYKSEKGFSSWRKNSNKDEEPSERQPRTFRPPRNDDDRPRRTDNDKRDDGRGRGGNKRGELFLIIITHF